MTLGTIKAWLEELYIGSSTDDYKSNPAVIVSKLAKAGLILIVIVMMATNTNNTFFICIIFFLLNML